MVQGDMIGSQIRGLNRRGSGKEAQSSKGHEQTTLISKGFA